MVKKSWSSTLTTTDSRSSPFRFLVRFLSNRCVDDGLPCTDIPEAWSLDLKGQRYNFLAEGVEQKRVFCERIAEAADLVLKKEKELEEAKETRRNFLKNAASSSSTAQMNSSLGILASGLAVDEADFMNSSGDVLEESVATGDAASRKAQEKQLRAKARDRVQAEVLSIISREKNGEGYFSKVDDYIASLGFQALFVAPVRMESTHRGSAPLAAGSGASSMAPALAQMVGSPSVGGLVGSHSLIIITPWALHIVAKKIVLFSTFLLDILSISSPAHPDVIITSKASGRLEIKSEFCDDVIYQLRKTIRTSFPALPEPSIEVDSWRLFPIKVDIRKLPLGGYPTTYQAICRYLGIDVRTDIIWDITHTETKVDRHQEFNLKYFEQPMELDDLRCVCGALRYNSFFTALVLDSGHMTKEAFAVVADVFRTNTAISKVRLPS